MKKIRLRHKLAVILPLGLGGLAFIGLLKDGHSAMAALTGTRTLVAFSCGVVAAVVFWVLARWLDSVPDSPYSLEDMIALAEGEGKPAGLYVNCWVMQLTSGMSRTVQILESQPLPVPTDFAEDEHPTFDLVIRRLAQMACCEDGTADDMIGLLIGGIDKTLQWELTGDPPERVLTLSVMDGPPPDTSDTLTGDEAAGEPSQMQKLVAELRDGKPRHSPERLSELNDYKASIHGRFWHTFLMWSLGMSIFPVGLLGFFWWASSGLDPKIIALTIVLLVMILFMGLLFGIASRLSSVEIADRQMRFVFAGMTRKRIPLEEIKGYECQFGHKRMIRIPYGKRWHSPGGLIDHRRIAEILEACGFHEVEDD